MRCVDCSYFWQESDEDRPWCHWACRAPGDMPPCEVEDCYEEEEDYE